MTTPTQAKHTTILIRLVLEGISGTVAGSMMLNSGFFNERKAKNVIKQKEKEIVRWQKLEF